MAYQCFPNDGKQRRWHGRHLLERRGTMQLRMSQSKFWCRTLRLVAAFRAWALRPARIKPFRVNRFH
jgi:hypothetical protein